MDDTNQMPPTPENLALWLPKRGRPFEVGPAPYTRPGANEVVVRTRAVGLNLVDGIPGLAYRLILPWLTFPAVIGGDVAGEIVEVGPGVDRFKVGDRVLGHALGLERVAKPGGRGRVPALRRAHGPHGLADPRFPVVRAGRGAAAAAVDRGDRPVPAGWSRPRPARRWTRPSVGRRCWCGAGSTGVGSNAIQLARNAGYRVAATASAPNLDYLRSLGAEVAIDRNCPTAVDELVAAIGESPLAGSLAIGNDSLPKVMRVAARSHGAKRVSSAAPGLVTRILALRAPRGVRVSGIWGGTLKDNEVGPGIYRDFLPVALATGAYRAEPPAEVVGHGLQAIPAGLQRLRHGVSAKKLVITV